MAIPRTSRHSPDPPAEQGRPAVRVSDLLGALSFALDLTEGQHAGHALRTCLISMRIAERLDLPVADRRDLYYASLLKDVGCSSTATRVFELFGGDDFAVKRDLKRVDWTTYLFAARHATARATLGSSWRSRATQLASLAGRSDKVADQIVEKRCTMSAEIINSFHFGPRVAEIVVALDERWDGRGRPRRLKGNETPLLARILTLAQTLDVFAVADRAEQAIAVIQARAETWFDPVVVKACQGMEGDIAVWCELDDAGLRKHLRDVEPGDAGPLAGPGMLDRIALGFAKVVDAKSEFTARHSERVTEFTLDVAAELGLADDVQADLRRAALLHDIGKLSVPNSILDKKAKLSSQEWEIMRLHPYYTQRILDRVEGFEKLAFVASSHHERLDGRGYFRGLRQDQLPLGAQILAVADIYEALTAPRPYRDSLSQEQALSIMERDRGTGLSPDCLDALKRSLERGEQTERAA